MRRVWQGSAVVLVALSWTFTFVPLPALPVRLAPAVFATICAVLLVVCQGRTGNAPEQHVADLHRVAEDLLDDVSGFRPLRYGRDPRMANLWRRSFEAHFRRAGRDLREWQRLLERDVHASQPVLVRIQRECGELEGKHGLNHEHCRAVLQKAVDSQLVNSPPSISPPTPFSIGHAPGIGPTLILGGSGIAYSSSESDLTAARIALEQATLGVAAWPELGPARAARLEFMRQTAKVREELVEIGHKHALTRADRCAGCST